LLTTTLDAGTVTWLSAVPIAGGISLRRHEVLDEGSDAFFDVYEFGPADPDEDTGVGTLLGTFSDVPSAFDAAVRNGANLDQWVNAGVIQDEYADLRASN
jgi:hypothetical protein